MTGGQVLNSFCLHITPHASKHSKLSVYVPPVFILCCLSLLWHISIFIPYLALFPSPFALCSILFSCSTPSPTPIYSPPSMSLSQSLFLVSMWVSVRRVVHRCLLSRAGIEDFNLFCSLLSSIRDLETEREFCSLSVSLSFSFSTLPFSPRCEGLADPNQVLIWFLRDEPHLSEDPTTQWDLL